MEPLSKQESGALIILGTCFFGLSIMFAIILCFTRRGKKKTIIQLNIPECKHKHGLAHSKKGSRALVVNYGKSRCKYDKPLRSNNVRVTIREPHPEIFNNGGSFGLGDSSDDISSSSEILQTVDIPPARTFSQPLHTVYDLSKPKKKKEGTQQKQENNKSESDENMESFTVKVEI